MRYCSCISLIQQLCQHNTVHKASCLTRDVKYLAVFCMLSNDHSPTGPWCVQGIVNPLMVQKTDKRGGTIVASPAAQAAAAEAMPPPKKAKAFFSTAPQPFSLCRHHDQTQDKAGPARDSHTELLSNFLAILYHDCMCCVRPAVVIGGLSSLHVAFTRLAGDGARLGHSFRGADAGKAGFATHHASRPLQCD